MLPIGLTDTIWLLWELVGGLIEMSSSSGSGGSAGKKLEDPRALLESLHLQEDELDDLIWEEEAD